MEEPPFAKAGSGSRLHHWNRATHCVVSCARDSGRTVGNLCRGLAVCFRNPSFFIRHAGGVREHGPAACRLTLLALEAPDSCVERLLALGDCPVQLFGIDCQGLNAPGANDIFFKLVEPKGRLLATAETGYFDHSVFNHESGSDADSPAGTSPASGREQAPGLPESGLFRLTPRPSS